MLERSIQSQSQTQDIGMSLRKSFRKIGFVGSTTVALIAADKRLRKLESRADATLGKANN